MTPTERLEELCEGRNPRLVAELPAGFVVMHEWQYWRGYCLLIANPLVGQLNDLDGDERAAFLATMARVGDALRELTGAVRINYSIYGNLDPFLHAHIIPRFADEEFPTTPPMSVATEKREAESIRYSASEHDRLRVQLANWLTTRG